jgi:hypothetical protein
VRLFRSGVGEIDNLSDLVDNTDSASGCLGRDSVVNSRSARTCYMIDE